MSRVLLLIPVLGWTLGAQVFTEPPLLIHLVRGESTRPYGQAKTAATVIGMSSLTGPVESWRVEMHGSFGSIEDTEEAMRRFTNAPKPEALSPELFGDSRSIVAVYRPGLSYRADQAIRLISKARYYYVSVHRVRLGASGDFSAGLRARREGLDDINLDRPDIAYQVVAGAPSGTYILLAPMTTLNTLDEGLARRAYQADQGTAKTDSELLRTHLLFRVEPGVSYVSDAFAAEAQELWRGKR
ncbi:MAG: hypothetical protein U0R19_40400 [Bryobacteraceae bacterium]